MLYAKLYAIQVISQKYYILERDIKDGETISGTILNH